MFLCYFFGQFSFRWPGSRQTPQYLTLCFKFRCSETRPLTVHREEGEDEERLVPEAERLQDLVLRECDIPEPALVKVKQFFRTVRHVQNQKITKSRMMSAIIPIQPTPLDRKSTRLNSSHSQIS